MPRASANVATARFPPRLRGMQGLRKPDRAAAVVRGVATAAGPDQQTPLSTMRHEVVTIVLHSLLQNPIELLNLVSEELVIRLTPKAAHLKC